MGYRSTLVVGALFVAGSLVIWKGGQTSAASVDLGNLSVAVNTAAASSTIGGGDAEYVGASKCKKCHLAEYKSWEKTSHAKAFDALKPGKADEAKTKAKLDPKKDYSKDAACIECHVQGMGKPGGFQMPADEAAAKKMEGLENVACENCHGPGGKYLALHEEIMKSKRKYKQDEMVASGLTIPDKNTCAACHNEKSPTFDKAAGFDFEKMKAKGVHEIQPLKQKE